MTGETGTGRRSRVVLYSSIGVAVVVALLIAVLASAHHSPSSPLLGKPAPPVAGPRLVGGGEASLSGYHGRWVLVTFAASWCVPCRQETPELEKFQSEHSRAGDAAVLEVAFDSTDVASLTSYLRKVGATWPAVNDPRAEVAFGVSQIPQAYLVDPAGTVVAKYFGPVTAAQVDAVIAKATSAR